MQMRKAAKRLIQKIIEPMGYELTRARRHRFTIEGVEYRTDRCSTGRTPEGEAAADGAIRMIRQSGKRGLAILDMCCGVGIIGLTIWRRLRDEPEVISRLAFADINVFNLLSLQRTVRANGIDRAFDGRVSWHLSDGLQHIPAARQFDLIIGNPPHYDDVEHFGWVSPTRLGTVDFGWHFHEQFYRDAHRYLTDDGQVWLFENRAASRVEDSASLIQANPGLAFLGAVPEPGAPRFFWVMSRCRPPAAA
jgi:hypothetical protein